MRLMVVIVKFFMCFCGMTSIAYGCSLIYKPAGWIVGGLMVFGISLVVDKISDNSNHNGSS